MRARTARGGHYLLNILKRKKLAQPEGTVKDPYSCQGRAELTSIGMWRWGGGRGVEE